MDERIEKICGLLDKIKDYLLEFEKETIEIITCDSEAIEEHSQNRVTITEKMDSVFKVIDEICKDMERGGEIRKIIRNVADFTTVDPELEPGFFKAQSIFSLLSRLKDSDVQAFSRVNIEKDMLLKKIREMNTGQEAKAAKFKIGTDTNENKAYLGFSKKTV